MQNLACKFPLIKTGFVSRSSSVTKISSCNAQDIRGNPSQLSVIAGNATADTAGERLLPLCEWLHVDYVLEQGDNTSVVHFLHSEHTKVVLCLGNW